MQKIITFYLFLYLLLSLAITPAIGQIDSVRLYQCQEKIFEINNLTLTKVHLSSFTDPENKTLKWKLSDKSNADGQAFIIYVDNYLKVRKYIETSYSEEESWVNIYYYDSFGRLCFTLQSHSVLSVFDYYSFIYSDNTGIIFANIKHAHHNLPDKSFEKKY